MGGCETLKLLWTGADCALAAAPTPAFGCDWALFIHAQDKNVAAQQRERILTLLRTGLAQS